MNQSVNFEHAMAAHCETGTIAALLRHAGLSITEPMVLGLSGGIFFAYLQTSRLPFPTFVTRTKPGDIRKKIARRLGVDFETRRFRSPAKARLALDQLIDQGVPTAAQVDMFYMDYIPHYMRAHFNGHFITVVGREDENYRVSDCYYPTLATVSSRSLEKGRFAGGDLAPRGFLFYPRSIQSAEVPAKAVRDGIRDACRGMLKIPAPFVGVKGIRLFARKVKQWPDIAGDENRLSHEIMMIHVILEERGTGGAGFRFMYATFLQQAATLLQDSALADFSRTMMSIGDRWREISLFVARIGRNRDLGKDRLEELSAMLLARADEEEAFFRELLQAVS
jgi:hypothetical protein